MKTRKRKRFKKEKQLNKKRNGQRLLQKMRKENGEHE